MNQQLHASSTKWTSPRAAQWVPSVSTPSPTSSSAGSPASKSSFEATLPRKRPRFPVENHVAAAEPSAIASRFAQNVDVFDQLQSRKLERKKTHLTATDEIRYLRAEVFKLEKTLEGLTAKWSAGIPSQDLLYSACDAARERSATFKSQALNTNLKNEFLLQQLYFAALQSSFTESPLLEYPNSRNIFDAIHADVHLPAADDTSRMAILNEALQESTRISPSLVQRLTRNHVERASLCVPYMGSSITADEEFTYVSTMFIAKIQHATVKQAFRGVLDYFRELRAQVEHHFGIQYDTQAIHNLTPSSEYGLVRYVKEGHFATSWNATLVSKLTNECGIVASDFVESDDMYPIERRHDRFHKEVSAIFTVSPSIDEATGVPCILLRQLRVARYNLLPNSKFLLEEIQIDKGFSNGDLLMAIVCRHLRELSGPE